MAKTVTPSLMTDGQIDKAVSHYRDMLNKHRREIGDSKLVQQVLGQDDFVGEMVGVLRKRVSGMIICRVKVDRTRTPQEALAATNRKQYTTDPDVVAGMPKGEGNEVEIIFFNIEQYVSDNDLEKEFESRGLIPTDPFSLAVVNENDPAFADEHPNGTHWKDSDGKWCYCAFNYWGSERLVLVYRDSDGWNDKWWFAGLRK